MDKIVIEGGNSLKGTIKLSGAKNAALPCIAATLLTDGTHKIKNVPQLRDIQTMKRIMSGMGLTFHEENDCLHINADQITEHEAPYDLVKTMRASILLLGPLVARLGKAKISLPGGCAIGARPINLHIKALESMGVTTTLDHGYIYAVADQLKGAEIFFDIPTVTGTENIMIAAVKAEGQTILKNCAREPEINNLAEMLRSMGAQIEGDGTDTITIEGVDKLKPAEHTVIPDRIEAGTFMIAAAMTRGEINIEGCIPDHLSAVIEKLQSLGAEIEKFDNGLFIKGPDQIRSVDIKTMPFPGFPTDLQAQLMTIMCIADGSSIIKETVFENRFIHVSELKRMGADIAINGNQALVRGIDNFQAAPVMATDLRASASLVLAGLAAKGGNTEVHRIYHLDRGYEDLEKKFRSIGAKVWREKA